MPFLRAFAISTLCFLVFAYGVGVGVYQWPPFAFLKQAVEPSRSPPGELPYAGERELLRFAFTEPLIDGDLIYEPVTTLEGIRQANLSILFPFEQFSTTYARLIITSASRTSLNAGRDQILKVSYLIDGKTFEAFAYTPKVKYDSDAAALIIPGSGKNQSSAIYLKDPGNYHFGVLEAIGDGAAKYVLVKPNEDFLAVHDGTSKLNEDFIIPWLFDRGASYSAQYIANSLAITKYLQRNYEKVMVAGLSQGGGAAFLNALQSHPDAAIISSGFSTISEKADWSGFRQIIIPGFKKDLDLEAVRLQVEKSETRFLFTYGKRERGTYKIEAEDATTCKFFAKTHNVSCEIHESGHEFPSEIIKDFLADTLQSH